MGVAETDISWGQKERKMDVRETIIGRGKKERKMDAVETEIGWEKEMLEKERYRRKERGRVKREVEGKREVGGKINVEERKKDVCQRREIGLGTRDRLGKERKKDVRETEIGQGNRLKEKFWGMRGIERGWRKRRMERG